jgi:hypothetical protein
LERARAACSTSLPAFLTMSSPSIRIRLTSRRRPRVETSELGPSGSWPRGISCLSGPTAFPRSSSSASCTSPLNRRGYYPRSVGFLLRAATSSCPTIRGHRSEHSNTVSGRSCGGDRGGAGPALFPIPRARPPGDGKPRICRRQRSRVCSQGRFRSGEARRERARGNIRTEPSPFVLLPRTLQNPAQCVGISGSVRQDTSAKVISTTLPDPDRLRRKIPTEERLSAVQR